MIPQEQLTLTDPSTNSPITFLYIPQFQVHSLPIPMNEDTLYAYPTTFPVYFKMVTLVYLSLPRGISDYHTPNNSKSFISPPALSVGLSSNDNWSDKTPFFNNCVS